MENIQGNVVFRKETEVKRHGNSRYCFGRLSEKEKIEKWKSPEYFTVKICYE